MRRGRTRTTISKARIGPRCASCGAPISTDLGRGYIFKVGDCVSFLASDSERRYSGRVKSLFREGRTLYIDGDGGRLFRVDVEMDDVRMDQ